MCVRTQEIIPWEPSHLIKRIIYLLSILYFKVGHAVYFSVLGALHDFTKATKMV